MSDALVKEILNELRETFSAAGLAASVEDIDGSDVLSIEYSEESAFEDGSILITHYDDIITVFIIITIWSGLEESRKEDMKSFLPYFNRFLTIGNFRVDDEDDTLEMRYSFIADDSTERTKLMKMIIAAYGASAAAAIDAAVTTAPVITGEKKASELLNEDALIIQF